MDTTSSKQFASENLPPDIQLKADRMNLDPAQIPPYELPPLPLQPGMGGSHFQHMTAPRLIELFERYMYGAIPPRCQEMEFRVTSEGPAFGTLGIRREIDLIFRHGNMERTAHLLLYLPAEVSGRCPVIFGLNFCGNHTTTNDPGVHFNEFTPLPDWNAGPRYDDKRAPASARGLKSGRWSFETLLKAGIAAATICYYDFFPDRKDGFEPGIMRMFYSPEEWNSAERPTGAISAWAWGIMRALDCLEAQPEIDVRRMMITGHSRLGKTALWAGACDRRIALTASNCSGCCGAKLSHRYFGESIEWIQQWNPHWMRADFERFSRHDADLPLDQHLLMAAIAPRLLYVASATRDYYADPEGEFLGAQAAGEAWKCFGGNGLGDSGFPAPGRLIGHEVGYYLRAGDHDITQENWDALLNFIRKNLDI